MVMSLAKQQKIAGERRQQIITSAMELFDKNGYSNTKIADIATHAGISKGLIYHYFRSKEEILLAVTDRVDACVAECGAVPDAMASLRLFILRLLSYPYYEEYVPPIRVFFTSLIQGEIKLADGQNPIREDFGRTFFAPIFARGQKQGYFRAGDPQLMGDQLWKYLVGYMATMSLKKAGTRYQPDIDQILFLYKK